MAVVQSIADNELAELKRLARQIVAAEAPELNILDQIGTLAAELAGSYRETARQELLQQVTENASAVFPSVARDLRKRLADASLYELSRLEALLDQALAARDALTRADGELMAARERGDYAAMAPLAMEADTRKIALADTGAEFEKRLGPDEAKAVNPVVAAVYEVPAGDAVAANPEPVLDDYRAPGETVDPELSSVSEGLSEPEAATPSGEPASNLVELGLIPQTRAERRRIRDLIRQVRSVPDEAS